MEPTMTPKNQEDINKALMGQGNDLLIFLNKAGVAPPMTPKTMNEFGSWQRCCNLAIGLMEGSLMLVKAEEPKSLLTQTKKTEPKRRAATKKRK